MGTRKKLSKEKRAEALAHLKNKNAMLRYLRIAPRKVKAVADTIRGRRVEEALGILDFTQRISAAPLARMLRAAVANASTMEDTDVDKLIVLEISVDQGPMLKRFIPRAMGRATPIHKKTSHVKLLLGEEKTK